jgi:hypothetical protein
LLPAPVDERPGVVDQDVYASCGQHAADEPGAACRVGEVRGEPMGFPAVSADRLRDLADPSRVAAVDDHGRALGRQHPGDRLADAAGQSAPPRRLRGFHILGVIDEFHGSGHEPLSGRRRAADAGNPRSPARPPGGLTGLERGLDGGRDEPCCLRSVDDDVPAQQHAADDLPGVRERAGRVDGGGGGTGGSRLGHNPDRKERSWPGCSTRRTWRQKLDPPGRTGMERRTGGFCLSNG